MANSHSVWFPKLLAQGHMSLRQNAVAPRFVNRAYETEGGQIGSTITIPVPSAISAAAVTPGPTQPANSDLTSTSKTISLASWFEARFYLSDKDKLEIVKNQIPVQASEAVKALANNIDTAIIAGYKKFHGASGVAGTTPFASDLTEFLSGRKNLTNQLADVDPRFALIDADAEANALGLRAFQDASFRGDRDGILNGNIGFKLGSEWAVDQNIPTHSETQAGTALIDFGSGYAVGVTTIHMDGFTTKPEAGDRFTLNGAASDSQVYVVASSTTLVGTDSDVTFQPPLKVLLASGDDSTAVDFAGDYVANLMAHRDAIAFVNRPLIDSDDEGLARAMSTVDPVSGLGLRLEIVRGYKQVMYSFDVLYGTDVPRPEFGNVLYG